MKKNLLLLFLFLLIVFCQGQQTLDASGGNASGSNGNVSFSIGQLTYQSSSDSNFSVTQGVQQPFEISTTLGANLTNLTLEIKVYPNPTASKLFLNYGDLRKNSSYQLFDENGRLILERKISESLSEIEMDKYTSGIYILKVFENSTVIKSFKIIKK